MEARLIRPFLQFAHNPALWIDDSYRRILSDEALPSSLLLKGWRRPEISPVLEQVLDFGAADELREEALEQPTARLILADSEQLQTQLAHVGICFCAHSLRVQINQAVLRDAREEIGPAVISFARSGAASECLDQVAAEKPSLPTFSYPEVNSAAVLGAGFGVWQAAAKSLGSAWIERAKYKMPVLSVEALEYDLTQKLPEDYCKNLIDEVIRRTDEDLKWLR